MTPFDTSPLDGVWVDGVLGAGVPADDPGLLFGLTAFETLRTYSGVPFRLDEHLVRLLRSAEAMRIDIPAVDVIRSQILARCEGDVSLRYTVTAGGRQIIQRRAIRPGQVARDMRVAQYTWVNPESLPGAVKHGCRAAWMLAAESRQVDEILLVDPEGQILEANRSNVFAVVDGVWVTPPLDGRQLAGVTRSALLDAARRANISVHERPLSITDQFDELYLASTLKELSAVVELDGQSFEGSGPLGQELLARFRTLVDLETGR